MGAQANSHHTVREADATEERRTTLRYRFAKLLTDRQFDAAMAEALVAHTRKEIRDADLQFVVDIVRAAERMQVRDQAANRRPESVVAPVSWPSPPTPFSGTA